jgi:hypothetical protein
VKAIDMSDSLRVVYRDQALCIATWKRLFFNRWYGAPDYRRFRILRACQRDFVANLPDGRHLVCSYLEARSGARVDERMRKDAAALGREMADKIVALGQVASGSGFFNAAARLVLSGIHRVTDVPYPAEVFADLESCATWLGQEYAQRVGGDAELVERMVLTLPAASVVTVEDGALGA